MFSQVRALCRRKRIEAEMAQEMRQHLDELTQRNLAEGMAPEKALVEARRRFGGLAQIEEQCRDARGFVWLGRLVKDFRFVVRSLCRSWGYTVTVLFTLILGTGATTLIHNVAWWSVFPTSPYPKSEQLFFVGFNEKQAPVNYWRPGVYFEALREQTDVFSQFAVSELNPANVVLNGEPVETYTLNLSASSFDTMGVKPVLGRGFLPGEDKEGADGVVVVSDRFWKDHFGGTADALGRKIVIDQRVCIVVGVLGKYQALPNYMGGEIFKPLVLKLDPANVFEPGLFILGRLKPGVTREQAIAALSTVRITAVPAWASKYFAGQSPVLTNINEIAPRDTWAVMLP